MHAAQQTPGITQATSSFLARSHGHWINGQWAAPRNGKTLDVEDPATGRNIATIAAGDAADIDAAVTAARAAFTNPAWSKMPAAQRGQILWKAADLILANFQQLVELTVLDNGMPLPLAQYTTGLFVPEFFRYYAGWPTKITGETIPANPQGRLTGDVFSFTLREPLGVVGAITPWNSPLAMEMLKIVPVLATGCTIVLKPAELTPLTAMRLMELLQEAGVPDGVVNLVNGTGEAAGAALAAHPASIRSPSLALPKLVGSLSKRRRAI